MIDIDGNGPPRCKGDVPAQRGRRRARERERDKGDVAAQSKRRNERKSEGARKNIAVLDLETDPFDGKTPVYPFLAVLYSDQFEPIVIWDENYNDLVSRVVATIEALPGKFTIYAHNGGRFDFMYVLKLLRGQVMFKGRALMRAFIGRHELRDSLHIIPESLKNANAKDAIDYLKFSKGVREKHRAEIIAYCLSDCRYTFETVSAFVNRFGLPMTIGQCAMKHLKAVCTFERLTAGSDEFLRRFFSGGRVECIAPAGLYVGAYKLFDVNSMYPSVMAYSSHPLGASFLAGGTKVTNNTAFIELRCSNPFGAFLSYDDAGLLTSEVTRGAFKVTIHEYETAMRLGLIGDVEILSTVNFWKWGNFADFVLPLYEERERLKKILDGMDKNTAEYRRIKQDATFIKYLLNSAYGKFAQNPKRFREYYLTEPGEVPPPEWQFFGLRNELSRQRLGGLSATQLKALRHIPEIETPTYWIWSHSNPEWRFNNVATAASITGAARAKLLEAKTLAIDPLYCDTDSLIARELSGVEIDRAKLGAWKLEKELRQVVIAGKKLYGFMEMDGTKTIKCKGVNAWNKTTAPDGVTWDDLVNIAQGAVIEKTAHGPTLDRAGRQTYLTRELRRTTR